MKESKRSSFGLVVDGSNTLGKKESYKITSLLASLDINQRWRWIHSLGEGLPAQKRANYVRMNRFCESCGLEETVKFQKWPGFPRQLPHIHKKTFDLSVHSQQQPSKRIFSRQADPSQSKQSKKSIHSINSSLTLLQNHDEY